jgi:hypothetical protein
MKKSFFPILILSAALIFLGISCLIFAQTETNQSMIVEANIFGFGNEDEVPEVGIEVPDYIFLGNVSRDDPVSDEKTINLNNTGKINITVTPRLRSDDEEIFKWLYFRTMKSSTLHPELNIHHKIGEYTTDIEKPSSGNTKRAKSIYMQLNLTDFEGNLREDIIGYQKEIIFFAMAQ